MRVRGRHRYQQFVNAGEPLVVRTVADAWSMASSYDGVHLEVGCGRGAFLRQLAAAHPGTFFIGIDYVPFVVAQAATYGVEQGLTNVRFVSADVENLIFHPHSLDVIYLNFSDPWPKRRQAHRRLTAASKLDVYAHLLKSGGELHMKTDNTELFDWSLRSLQFANWRIMDIDRSVPNEPPREEAGTAKFTQTEYEMRFRARGLPIAYLSARAPADSPCLMRRKEAKRLFYRGKGD